MAVYKAIRLFILIILSFATILIGYDTYEIINVKLNCDVAANGLVVKNDTFWVRASKKVYYARVVYVDAQQIKQEVKSIHEDYPVYRSCLLSQPNFFINSKNKSEYTA